MTTSREQAFLEANKKYSSQYKPGVIPIGPTRKVVVGESTSICPPTDTQGHCESNSFSIVTCMDSRLDPATAYGLGLGEVTVVRNAGASARDAARSVLISAHILGAEDVFIVKHTHCGLLGGNTEIVHQVMKKNLGVTESKAVNDFEVLPIADLEESAKEDVAYLHNHELSLKKVRVTDGFMTSKTGILKKVVD